MHIAKIVPSVPKVVTDAVATADVVLTARGAGTTQAAPKKKKPNLKQIFRFTKELLEEIAKTAKYLAPGVIDPYSILKAEENVALRRADRRNGGKFWSWLHGDRAAIEEHFDAKRRELAKTVPRDYVDRLEWAKGQLEKEVVDQKAKVGALGKRVDDIEAEISRLEETDARTAKEKAAGEPPHPPHRKIFELKQELEATKEDLGIEKQILRDLEKELPGKLRTLDDEIAGTKRSRKFRKAVKDWVLGR
jgi:hypothetical protein